MTTMIKTSTDKELSVLVLATDGTPATGLTVNVAIRRASDGKWWEGTGGTWENTKQNNAMTEISDGLYRYTFVAAGVGSTSEATFVAYYQETTTPAYGVEELLAVDLFADVTSIDGKVDTIDSEVGTIDGKVDDIKLDLYFAYYSLASRKNQVWIDPTDPVNSTTQFKAEVDWGGSFDLVGIMEGRRITFLSGNLKGQSRIITDYTAHIITVDPAFPEAPDADSIDALVTAPEEPSPLFTATGSVITDGGTTPSYFKTDLESTTLDYWQNVQVLFLTGDNAGIARRISSYSTAKFITTSEAFPNTPSAMDAFVIVGSVAGAGSALTEAGIADAVWDENKSGHTASETYGKIVQDVETDVDAILVDTAEMQGKLPTNYIMGSSDVDDHDTDIDAILVDTADMQPKVDAVYDKLPSSDYIKGTADADGGMDTADKADVNAEVDQALLDYDPPTKTEMDTFETNITAEVDANEAKLDILTTMVAQIQNNVFFSTTTLDMYQRPESGSDVYRIRAMIFDGTGNPEDPDSEEIYITLDGTSGNIVARQLMTKQDVGVYYYDLTIQSSDTLEEWTFTFDYLEGAVAKYHYRQSSLTEWTSDMNDIQTKVTAIHVKVDAVAPSPTIPAQILTHDTDIKALPNIQATPEYLVIPSGMTRINLEGGVDAIVTDIPVYDISVLGRDGEEVVVLIGTEYVTGTIDSTDSQLTSCTRGAYSTVAAAHADLVSVYEVMIHPIRLNIHDNEQNMVTPDSAPTLEIVDWAGTQELAPTAMTLITTGVYGYDYFQVAGYRAESKTLRFSVTVDSITTVRQSIVMVLDKPSSQNDLLQIAGGGTGEYLVTQDGYMDGDGVWNAWTDSLVGYLRDATTGARLDDVLVTAYKVVNGQTILAKIPPGQTVCDDNGNYEMRLDAGTYVFKFHKDQYRFPTDEVTRTVTD